MVYVPPDAIPLQFIKESFMRNLVKSFREVYQDDFRLNITIMVMHLFNTCMSDNNWLSHDLLRLKPCCKSYRILLFSRCCMMCEAMICSNNLQVIQVSEIGL